MAERIHPAVYALGAVAGAAVGGALAWWWSDHKASFGALGDPSSKTQTRETPVSEVGSRSTTGTQTRTDGSSSTPRTSGSRTARSSSTGPRTDMTFEIPLLQAPEDLRTLLNPDPAVRRRVAFTMSNQLDAIGAPAYDGPVEARAARYLSTRHAEVPVASFSGGDIAGQTLFWAARKVNDFTYTMFYS